MRRRLLLVLLLPALAGAVPVLWLLLDLPPPRLVLRYGPSPAPAPTGEIRTGALGLRLVEISAGACRMGAHVGCFRGDALGRVCRPLGIPLGREPACEAGPCGECPPEWVEIGEPFWIGREEVTVEQVRAVLGEDWYDPEPDEHPAARASWDDAKEFCRLLSEREPGTYRLPTEVEWDCVARAGESLPERYPPRIVVLRPAGGAPLPDFGDWDAYSWSRTADPSTPNAWGIRGMTDGPDELCALPLPRPADHFRLVASNPHTWVGAGADPWAGERHLVPVRRDALGRPGGDDRPVHSRYLVAQGFSWRMIGFRVVWTPDETPVSSDGD